MSIYETPIKSVYESIQRGDLATLSDNLDQLYDSGKRSAEVKAAVVFGYKVLADAVGDGDPDPVLTFLSYDRARQMFWNDHLLLENELNFLHRFTEEFGYILSDPDWNLIKSIARLVISNLPKSILDELELILSKFQNIPIPGNCREWQKPNELFYDIQTMIRVQFSQVLDRHGECPISEFYCSDCKINYADGIWEPSNGRSFLQFATRQKCCPECGSTHEKLLSVKSFAEELDCSQHTVRAWIRDHKIKVNRIHGLVRIPASEIHRNTVVMPAVNE
jgi:excisionase family DNA binding protein